MPFCLLILWAKHIALNSLFLIPVYNVSIIGQTLFTKGKNDNDTDLLRQMASTYNLDRYTHWVSDFYSMESGPSIIAEFRAYSIGSGNKIRVERHAHLR